MFDAVARAAARWRNPHHPARLEAVRATLEAPNSFTPAALAFAIDQQMALLDAAALRAWLGTRRTGTARTVGVLNAGNVPLAGLQDLLAVVGTGHRYVGTLSKKSPALLPAFAQAAGLDARFVPADQLWACAEAVIATGTDDTRRWAAAQAARHGLARAQCLLRGHSYSAAVIDGGESAEERMRLAEDALLHEGMGCRSVALIWAPKTLEAAPYVESMMRFRRLFPAHRRTAPALAMQHALLKALAMPHGGGPEPGFLLSFGPAEPQGPLHLRWVTYGGWAEVARGLAAHVGRLQRVFVRAGLLARLQKPVPTGVLGSAQRPALDWQPDQRDTAAFLASL